MPRNILINFFLLSFVSICSCDPVEQNHITNFEGGKNQTDSVKFKHDGLNFSKGKQLFSRLCNTCHVAPEKNVTDQYLFANLFERLPAPSEDYFVSFISDSRSLKATGNKYAKLVDTMWHNNYEHNFRDRLSKQDFYNLITYIKIAAKQRYQSNE